MVEVELEIAQEDDVARAVGCEHAVDELENVEWIGAWGDASFVGINEALGGGPGVEFTVERLADGGDFGLHACFFGTDDGEAGIAGTEIGGEVHGDRWGMIDE